MGNKTSLEARLADVQKKYDRLLSQLATAVAKEKHYRSENERLTSGVRYRIGDAIVRAATPSLDTLLLPFRLMLLFIEGVRRNRQRVQDRLHEKTREVVDDGRGGVASIQRQARAAIRKKWKVHGTDFVVFVTSAGAMSSTWFDFVISRFPRETKIRCAL